MGCCSDVSGLLPIEEAIAQIGQLIKPLNEVKPLPLDELVGTVLAEDIISPIDVPGCDNSAMDGYALRYSDLEHYESFELIGKSFAGAPFNEKVSSGQCVRIMTGAKIPKGADCVVMQEKVQVLPEGIQLLSYPKKGEAIRKRGEDIRHGAVVLGKGHLVEVVDLGILASIGIQNVDVYRKPVVALFSTGDELKQPGDVLPSGFIYDSNRPVLKAMISQAGFNVIDYGVVEDDPDSIRKTFLEADQLADVVITSGGVSVGEADFTREILDEIGEIAFWKLAIKPGKPLAFGRLPNSYFFGLPGNPVSASVTCQQVALPALRRLSGAESKQKMRLPVVAAKPFKKVVGRTDFQRGIWTINEQGIPSVSPLDNQSSGVLSSLSNANCYIVLERDRGSVAVGESVYIEPFNTMA